jgi:radical SAM protein
MSFPTVNAHPAEADAADQRRSTMQHRFNDRPLLVFWEVTTACDLACRHCRADAQHQANPHELNTVEGRQLIDELSQLASPRPILVLTGGDCLKRPDLLQLIDYAKASAIPVALAPSVTPLLTRATMDEWRDHGVKTVSISLDGMDAATHDGVRGVPGHFSATLTALRELKEAGFTVQINTTVMAGNVEQLSDIVQILLRHDIDIWEVFLLVATGRGAGIAATSPQQNEDVGHFLVDASRYGVTVRTVEGPFVRRIAQQRHEGVASPATGELYDRLRRRLRDVVGEPTHTPCVPSAATRDGNGIVFVGATGEVYPSGFLPRSLGNVRRSSLMNLYRNAPLMRAIRDADFQGACGRCSFKRLCGGSRSRAFAATRDPLGSDPACVMVRPLHSSRAT